MYSYNKHVRFLDTVYIMNGQIIRFLRKITSLPPLPTKYSTPPSVSKFTKCSNMDVDRYNYLSKKYRSVIILRRTPIFHPIQGRFLWNTIKRLRSTAARSGECIESHEAVCASGSMLITVDKVSVFPRKVNKIIRGTETSIEHVLEKPPFYFHELNSTGCPHKNSGIL